MVVSDTPKPQPTPSPPAPPPLPVPAAAGTTMGELEAAIEALAAKKLRLREAFDCLVACSPIPIPFRWDDIDAHVSSIQSSIAGRLRQFQALQTAATAGITAAPATSNASSRAERPVEHLVVVVEGHEPHVERHEDGGNGEGEGEGGLGKEVAMDVESEEENGMVVEVASEAPRGEEDGEVKEDEKMGEPINASPPSEEIHGKGADAKNPMEMSADKDDAKTKRTAAAAELSAMAISPIRGFTGRSGTEASLRRSLAAACASMDSSSLARILCSSGSSSSSHATLAARHFRPALLAAAEPAALVVRAVRDLLAGTAPIGDSAWESCVELLSCVPKLAVALSPGTMEQANRLAEDWKEMIGRTESCSMNLGRLAVWGLLNFLVSYNIVLEFDAEEIIHFFGTLPDDKKQCCISLCKYLGLIDKMADSVGPLIEHGQQLVAIRLACTLNLTDKYTTLSIMEDYIQNAKETAQEILSMESDSESLKLSMSKQVNALILSWRVVGECNIDSVHCDRIKAEITQLLHKYANKRHSLEDLPSDTSSPHQKHHQMSQERHHWQQKHREEQQQQQLQNQSKEQEQERRMQKLREMRKKKNKRTQRRKRKQNAQVMKQHQFEKQRKLYHAGSFTNSQSYVRSEIHHHLSQHFSGTIGTPVAPYTPFW
uniref:FRIGIDA-like protein n=1 Tax=Oryza meridionalis TaxID=40149 RepID=A0A0E0D3G1_9ORYZ